MAETAEVERRSSAGTAIAMRQRWLDFAGMMTQVTGGLNVIDGRAPLQNLVRHRHLYPRQPTVLVGGPDGVWGIQLAAGFAILGRQGWGRWFGLITVTVNAFTQLFVITSYPFWAAIIIAYEMRSSML